MPIVDLLLAVANAVFILALLPTLREGFRVRAQTIPLLTVGAYMGALSLLTGCFLVIGMWFAAATEIVGMAEWLLVGWQRWRFGPPATTTSTT